MMLSVKLGQRLTRFHFQLFIKKNIEGALRLAVKLNENTEQKPINKEINKSQDVARHRTWPDMEIISKPEWRLEMNNFIVI